MSEQEEFEFRLRLEQELSEPKKPSAAGLVKREVLAALSPLRGVKDVVDTGAEYLARGFDKIAGTKEGDRVKAMNDAGKAEFAQATEGSMVAPVGRLAGNIGATAPVGGALAAPVRSVAPRLANAVASGGMSTGAQVAPNLLSRVGDMGIRMAGGAATGGVSAAMIDPEMAGTGAAVGAALPPVAKAAGAVGQGIGRALSGPPVAPEIRAAVQSAQQAGYVIPPSQAKPSLVNRVLEGTAGKITTAQNASVKNQAVTNALAKASIGADDLTPEALQAVRSKANEAYSQLAAVGQFQADDAFKTALQKAAGNKALPGISNKEVDGLVDALSAQGTLDAQQTIESIKRLRFEGSGNKSAPDPVKRALGQAQMKIAGALEDLIDRNLSGAPELLANYRAARQTLAKVYDVEKALNQTSGNVDANKLAALLKKGRPLSGELKQAAEFAGQFPRAAQMPERMGSLPQTSPLDLWGAGIASGVTGNPLMMGAALARPAARSLALSPMVQNRLSSPGGNALAELLSNPELQQLVYRGAPVASAR